MRALTVMQPWAWAIFHGKTVENRTQLWRYRGAVAIHAGSRWSQRGGESDLVGSAWGRRHPHNNISQHGALPEWLFAAAAAENVAGVAAGAIIGVVDLVDAHPDAGCCRPWGESSYNDAGGRQRRRVVHLVLEDPRVFAEPIACRGALGLWTPPPQVVDDIRSAAAVSAVPR